MQRSNLFPSSTSLGVPLWIVCGALLWSPIASLRAADAAVKEPSGATTEGPIELSLEGGKYRVTIDSSGSPDLQTWAAQELAPVVTEWYPKIVRMLPGKDFEAPTEVTIKISDDIEGVAYTSGNKVYCNGTWFKRNLAGEAKGAVVHELVHAVQQYQGWRNGAPREARPPGWLVEGVADYVRWFLYEPESGGALINQQGADRARHDASYRTSANFLNWVAENYGASLIPKLNSRLRTGAYRETFWEEYTGKSLNELAAAWKESLRKPQAEEPPTANQLTDKERKQGWRLLFDGESLDGWHGFKREDVQPGWKISGGELICQDPSQAGDLCTNENFEWFELELEYNITQGGNSGILFHVTDEGRTTWATGPELQLEDNLEARDAVRSGWLYALYQPTEDPDTGAPIDATKPAGQWNKVRLLVSPRKCVHEINGVKYFEYKLNGKDFRQRVKQSKFSRMPLLAKSRSGMIALQGDHGAVSFRNIKIRPLGKQQDAPDKADSKEG